MKKKTYILILLSVAIFVGSLIGVIAYFKGSNAQKTTLNIQTDETIRANMIIKQQFLNETVTLFQSDLIDNKHQEIEAQHNKGESSIVLIFEGTEETILGYLDTHQNISSITLHVENKNHEVAVRYTVNSTSGKVTGEKSFPLS